MRTAGFYWTPSPERRDDQIAALIDCHANTVVIPLRAAQHELLQRLTANGLRVYVDMALFAGADLRDEQPDSAPIDEHGAVFEPDDWYVPACPNNVALRYRYLATLRSLLAAHGGAIAGIWLDFVRYPVRWEKRQPNLRQVCFCDRCLALFLGHDHRPYSSTERGNAIHTILRQHGDAWIAWKCQRIADFVAEVRAVVKTTAPTVELGAFCLPWRPTDFDGAIRAIAGQEVEQIATHADCISPMVYHRLCGQPLEWISAVVHDTRGRIARPVLPIVQSLDQPDTMPLEEIGLAIDQARDASDRGVLVFDFASVERDPARLALVRERFARL